jgi:hypothetical protein
VWKNDLFLDMEAPDTVSFFFLSSQNQIYDNPLIHLKIVYIFSRGEYTALLREDFDNVVMR